MSHRHTFLSDRHIIVANHKGAYVNMAIWLQLLTRNLTKGESQKPLSSAQDGITFSCVTTKNLNHKTKGLVAMISVLRELFACYDLNRIHITANYPGNDLGEKLSAASLLDQARFTAAFYAWRDAFMEEPCAETRH